MARKTKIEVIRHRDGDEYAFKCPKCGAAISCGSWNTKVICIHCQSKIKIVFDLHAELEDNNG